MDAIEDGYTDMELFSLSSIKVFHSVYCMFLVLEMLFLGLVSAFVGSFFLI